MINSNIGYIINESECICSAVIQPKLLNGKAIAECILQTADETNRNGRIYRKADLFPALKAPRLLELIRTGTLRAECGHPLSKDLQRQSTIDDTKTCARFLKIWTEGLNIMGHVVGTNSELGRAFDLDLKEGVLPAWSLRALGSLNQTNKGCEVKNLRIITWDNVIYPSHPNAYTQRLVTESSGILLPKTNLQSLVESTSLIAGNDDLITETNDLSCSAILSPMSNEDVIRYIQSSSDNLKFVRECFDFAYDSIQVNEAGTKVILNTYDGDVLYVNIESYIHDELMRYDKNYSAIREASEENFSILSGMKNKSVLVENKDIDEDYIEEKAIKVDFDKSFKSSISSSKLDKNDDEYKDNLKLLKDKFNFSKLPKLKIKSVGESVELEPVDEGIFFGKKKEDNKPKTDPNYPINVGNYNLALYGVDGNNRPVYICKQITIQNKLAHLFTTEYYSPLSENNLHIIDNFTKFIDKNFRDMVDAVIRQVTEEKATISSYKGTSYVQNAIYKNEKSETEIEVLVGLITSIDDKVICMAYKHNFNTKNEGLYI